MSLNTVQGRRPREGVEEQRRSALQRMLEEAEGARQDASICTMQMLVSLIGIHNQEDLRKLLYLLSVQAESRTPQLYTVRGTKASWRIPSY